VRTRGAVVIAVMVGTGLGSLARADTLVLRGATVLPQDSEPVVNADLVIESGRVSALGVRGAVTLPPGARTIDLAGQFVVPGLVDAHSHPNEDHFLELYAAYGVTTVRDLGNRLDRIAALRSEVAAGRLGPEIVYVGPILDGTPAGWPCIDLVLDDPRAVRPALERLEAAGVSSFKVYEMIAPEVLDAILAEGKRAGIPVIGHVPRRVGLERCIESGMDTIEHMSGFARVIAGATHGGSSLKDEIEGWGQADEAALTRILGKLVAHGTRLSPTCVVVRNYSRLLRGIPLSGPEQEYVPRRVKEPYFVLPLPPGEGDDHEACLAKKLDFVRRAHAAGIRILAGTDVPDYGVIPGFSMHEEIEELARALGPEEALRSATLENARALRRTDIGRIASGVRADLLVLEKDPRLEAKNTLSIEAVVLAGRYLDRRALDGMRDAARAAARAIDASPTTGFAAVPALGPGRAADEVWLEGRLEGASAWTHAGDLETPGQGSRRVLRAVLDSTGTATLDETVTRGAGGTLVAFDAVETRTGATVFGETHELVIAADGHGFTAELRAGGLVRWTVALEDETVLDPALLLLGAKLQGLGLTPGAIAHTTVRPLDLGALRLEPPVSAAVQCLENPIVDPASIRSQARCFEVVFQGAEPTTLTIWVDAHGIPVGFERVSRRGKASLAPR
jgi:imidazolonepropionase-like amidohydrolase